MRVVIGFRNLVGLMTIGSGMGNGFWNTFGLGNIVRLWKIGVGIRFLIWQQSLFPFRLPLFM